jgi:hypothetical protein
MAADIVWSYGGGVQSVAILVLIAQGRLPKPARVVMADTGRERSLTWEYTEAFARPLLGRLGLELEVISHELAAVDLYSHKGELLLPAFSKKGKLHVFCSVEWKRRVIWRYLRGLGYGPTQPVLNWLGMSLDEILRMHVSDRKWMVNEYPLVFDVPLRRHECLLTIERFGLPHPPKSACWCCPNMTNAEWQEMKDKTPEDFARAVALEHEVSARDTKGGVWLHASRLPLGDVDFTARESAPQEMLCAASCWT